MKFRRTVVALSGSALMLTGCGSQPAASPTTVTVPTTIIKTSLVEVTYTRQASVITTVTMPPVTITASGGGGAAGGAPAGNGPTGPFIDGTYLVGTDVASGNYKCSNASDNTRWIVEDSAGETLDIDFSSVARVPANGYTIQFKECGGQWEKVG